jgi:hypothetical protein
LAKKAASVKEKQFEILLRLKFLATEKWLIYLEVSINDLKSGANPTTSEFTTTTAALYVKGWRVFVNEEIIFFYS